MRLGQEEQNTTRLNRRGERGQAIVLVLLAVGLFLVGMVAVAVDFTSLWFHRQVAQSAADSACVAGAVDMMAMINGAVINPHFTPGTAFNCSATHPNTNTSTAPTPCWYAQANGFATAGLGGNPPREVAVSFPGTITGVTAPSSGISPYPFMQVVTEEDVRVYFAGLFSGRRTQRVRTSARCGLKVEMTFPPILVLRPTGAATFRVNGTSHAVSIYGGPQRGIQVNSNNQSPNDAASLPSGCSAIMLDLSQGGPNLTGSDVGVFGGPLPPAPCSFDDGTTGHWLSPASPMADPLLTLPAPAVKPANGTVTTVAAGVNGCPATVTSGCRIFEPGAYNGITIQGSATNIETALFKPGLYWVENQMAIKGNSCVRPWDSGNPLDGATFYFADNQSIDVASNGGKDCVAAGVPTFNTTSAKCTGASQIPGNLTGSNGNFADTVLLGPCTGTYGDPQGNSNPTGMQRGVLFFQNRSRDMTAGGSKPPSWQGGGNFLLVGTIYLHQCTTGGAADAGGTGCSSSAYKTKFTFQADGDSIGALIGNIITDELTVGGHLILDVVPSAGLIAIKASLMR